MEDKELKSLIKKTIIFIVVFIVFGGLLIKIMINNFSYEDVSVGTRIDKEETFLLLIVNEKNNYKDIVQYLKDNSLEFEIVNSDKEKYYNDFLYKLNITKYEINEPSLLDIREGKVFSILTDVQNDDRLISFVNSYNSLEEEE